MQTLYIFIVILASHAFLSEKINTDNLLKKFALGFLIVGALIGQYQLERTVKIDNWPLLLGVVLYFTAECFTAFFRKHNSRVNDKVKA